ncbi:hypothetical protein BGX23_003505 [Mortierella sp. AD031]|nr:hypothetical protein BGX23_003505 [Mortierella sp. AD031]
MSRDELGMDKPEVLHVNSFRPSKFVERMVQAQSVHCPTTTVWCRWEGPLKDANQHLKTCNFACEHNCQYRTSGCTFKGGATDMEAHNRHCSFRPRQPSDGADSSSNSSRSPNGPSRPYPQSSFGARQFSPSTGQGPRSPPPPPMVPPPPPHPHQSHHRPIAQRAGAHPARSHGLDHLEEMSIDSPQREFDAQLAEDDHGTFSPKVATRHLQESNSEEPLVQGGQPDFLGGMEVVDLAMSPVLESSQQTQGVAPTHAQPFTQEVTPTQETDEIMSPIIIQQIEEEALLAQYAQAKRQDQQRAQQAQQEETQEEEPEIQCGQQIADASPMADLPTLSPVIRTRALTSSPPPPNVHPPARRRRIIIKDEDSDQSSGYVSIDVDNTEATCLEITEQVESAGPAFGTHHRRQSAPSALQEPPYKDKGCRVLRDITRAFVSPDGRPLAVAATSAPPATSVPTTTSAPAARSGSTSTPTNPPRSTTVRSVSSPDGQSQALASRSTPIVRSIFPPPSTAGQSSTSTARLGPGTGVGLTADVFNILNPHSCQSPRKSHGFGHRPASGKTIAKSSRARTSNRFAPLSMRPVTVQPTEVPLSMQSKIIATTAQGSGPSPDFSSDDEAEREARQAADLDDRQSYIPLLYGNQAQPRYFHPRGKKAAKKYGLPIVYDKGAQERYKLLNPSPLTPELTTPESSVA